ncbi:MAG: 30S ribosome-binding factor RbfA [bacterium]|jgi:ribosome-binding factor A|nr:30S ribosome-binding factor RbfA [Bacillota bacterium]HHW55910.1 30S ribosome-binding factor RbfA [Bacillota bacterium]
MGVRQQRVREAYRQELSQLIQRELKDPRIGFLSITDVEVSGDLRQVKVYVSVMGDQQVKEETMAALDRARSFLRSEMGKRVRLRYTPELFFYLDESIERGVRLKGLLDQLGQEIDEEKEKGTDAGGEEEGS